MKAAIAEVGTLQALLNTKRQDCTLSPSMERELVQLRHSYDRLREIVRDLGFDAVRLLHTYSLDDPILLTGFKVLCKTVADYLGHV